MTVSVRQPENTSLFQSRKFTFVFPTLPFLNYFVQNTEVPGLATSAPPVPTTFATTYRHGDNLIYDPLVVTVIVDEDLRVWEETYNWILALTKPQEFRQYWRNSNGRQVPYHDSVLTLNNNANNPTMRYRFRDCHPTNISPLELSTMDNANVIKTIDITFRYDTYDFERV